MGANEERIAVLGKQVEELTNRIGMLEDANAIRTLQHKYGYYMDKSFYEAIIELFTEDCEIHFLGGIFRGKAGARRLFIDRFRANFARGVDGPKNGILMEHPQLQDVITVAPDRRTAKARFRYFMQAGTHYTTGKAYQFWEGGLYENVYAKKTASGRSRSSYRKWSMSPNTRQVGPTRGRSMWPSWRRPTLTTLWGRTSSLPRSAFCGLT